MVESIQATSPQRRGALWDFGLSWLLGEAESALGFRGTTGSVISMIERGGPSIGDDHEHVTDQQLGWGKCLRSSASRWRPLWDRWRRLELVSRNVFAAHYSDVRLPPGVATAFRISDADGLRPVCCGAVALMLVGPEHAVRVIEAAGLLDSRPQAWAQTQPGRQAVGILKGPKQRAEEAVRAAHLEWSRLEDVQLEAWVG